MKAVTGRCRRRRRRHVGVRDQVGRLPHHRVHGRRSRCGSRSDATCSTSRPLAGAGRAGRRRARHAGRRRRRDGRAGAEGVPRFELLQRHEVPVDLRRRSTCCRSTGRTRSASPTRSAGELPARARRARRAGSCPAHQIGDGRRLLEVTSAQRPRGRSWPSASAAPTCPASGRRRGARSSTAPPAGGRDRRLDQGRRATARTCRCACWSATTRTARLRYGGGVGTGFDRRLLESLQRTLRRAGHRTSARSIRRHRRSCAARRDLGAARSWWPRSPSPSGPSRAWCARPASSGSRDDKDAARRRAGERPGVRPAAGRGSARRRLSDRCGRSRRRGCRRRGSVDGDELARLDRAGPRAARCGRPAAPGSSRSGIGVHEEHLELVAVAGVDRGRACSATVTPWRRASPLRGRTKPA